MVVRNHRNCSSHLYMMHVVTTLYSSLVHWTVLCEYFLLHVVLMKFIYTTVIRVKTFVT